MSASGVMPTPAFPHMPSPDDVARFAPPHAQVLPSQWPKSLRELDVSVVLGPRSVFLTDLLSCLPNFTRLNHFTFAATGKKYGDEYNGYKYFNVSSLLHKIFTLALSIPSIESVNGVDVKLLRCAEIVAMDLPPDGATAVASVTYTLPGSAVSSTYDESIMQLKPGFATSTLLLAFLRPSLKRLSMTDTSIDQTSLVFQLCSMASNPSTPVALEHLHLAGHPFLKRVSKPQLIDLVQAIFQWPKLESLDMATPSQMLVSAQGDAHLVAAAARLQIPAEVLRRDNTEVVAYIKALTNGQVRASKHVVRFGATARNKLVSTVRALL